jgi:hypothetical protein
MFNKSLKIDSKYPSDENTISDFAHNFYISVSGNYYSEKALIKRIKNEESFFTVDLPGNIAEIYVDANNNLKTSPDESLSNNLQKIKQQKYQFISNSF